MSSISTNQSLLASFNDLRKDETCIIIGNGPSLMDVPTELLQKYSTFGTNKIFMHPTFPTPTYYVAVNPLVVAQNAAVIEALPCYRFLSGSAVDSGFDALWLRSMPAPLFSYDPSRYVYEGHTVTFVCMQLAFFMGYTTVLLVGVDHSYVFEGPANQPQALTGDDPNHFTPEYFKGQMWHTPDLPKSEQAYQMAQKAFDDDGRRILNLTTRTELTVFPQDDWRNWL